MDCWSSVEDQREVARPGVSDDNSVCSVVFASAELKNIKRLRCRKDSIVQDVKRT